MGNDAETVQVGVIGVGALGRHHVRLYKECAQAEVAGVYDSNFEQAQKIATEFNAPLFSEQNQLIEACEALSVAVPTDRHFSIVQHLLESGKHVLVEKPIASTVSEARQLVDLARQYNLALGVGHVERFNPVLDCIHQVEGAPRFIEAYRLANYPPARPGQLPRGTEVSVMHDLMIHDIDVILSLVGQAPARVDAIGVPVLSSTVDIANARLTFGNGCVANLTASRVSAEGLRKIRMFKSNAYLSLDYGAQQAEMANIKDGRIVRQPVHIDPRNALQEELEDFCSCVLEKKRDYTQRQPRVSGGDALEALNVVTRIEQRMIESPLELDSTYG